MRKLNTFWAEMAHTYYALIHQGRYSVSKLSEITGIPETTIYRNAMGFMDVSSGLTPSLKNTILYMKTQRNFSVLKLIANYCGFILGKLPRVGRNKKDTAEKIADLQELHAKTIRCLLEYNRMPLALNRADAIKMLVRSIEYEASLVRDLKFNFHQLELPLFEGEQ